MVSYLLPAQGPASSLDCPAMGISVFLDTGNELQLLTLGAGRPSTSCLKHTTRLWVLFWASGERPSHCRNRLTIYFSRFTNCRKTSCVSASLLLQRLETPRWPS